jgi:hypothetical protein
MANPIAEGPMRGKEKENTSESLNKSSLLKKPSALKAPRRNSIGGADYRRMSVGSKEEKKESKATNSNAYKVQGANRPATTSSSTNYQVASSVWVNHSQ